MSFHSSMRIRKVQSNNVIYPEHQALKNIPNMHTVLSIAAVPSPSTTILVNGGTYHFRINHKAIERIKGMNLRFDVSEADGSAAFVATATPYFVEEIEWKQGNKVFYNQYDDQMFWEYCNLVPDVKQNLEDLNVSKQYYKGATHSLSKTRSYRLPMVGHPWVINNEYPANIKGNDIDIVIKFRGGIKESGSGVPQLDGVYLEIDQESMTDGDKKTEDNQFNQTHAHRYLDWDHVQYTSQTLNRGTQLKLDLNQIAGKDVPFLLFAIRADSYAASSGGFLKCLKLPDKSTVDILDSNSKSIFGNGTGVEASLISKTLYYKHLDSKFPTFRNWYMIPFCNEVREAFHGVKDNYLHFGNKYQLAIKPYTTAGVAGVWTSTITGTADADYYRIMVHNPKNGITSMTSDMKFDVTTQDTSVNALPACTENPTAPLTFAASGAATATFTMTANVNDDIDDKFEMKLCPFSINDGGVEIFSTDTCSTAPILGWTNSSTMTVDIYVPYFRNLFKSHGKLKAVNDAA